MKNTERERAPDDIPADVSGIAGWALGRRTVDAGRGKIPKRRITIHLDADIVAIFKAEATRGGLPYQVAINQALRAFLLEREKQGEARAVETVMAALDDPAVQEKVRALVSPSSRRRAR